MLIGHIYYIGAYFFRGLEYDNSLHGKQPIVESENKAKYVYLYFISQINEAHSLS